MPSDVTFKPGTGLLFRNTPKRTMKSPDWSGTFTAPSGKQFKVAIWESGSRAHMRMQPKDDSDG